MKLKKMIGYIFIGKLILEIYKQNILYEWGMRMKEFKYSPVVISGPSGAGKSELIEFIEKQNSLFLEATGSTTREKRVIEHGRMNFISREEFEQLIAQGQLIEYTEYNGNYYGVSKQEFEKLNENYMIFNVGYSSAKIIKCLHHDSYMIYLLPPTKEELLLRMKNRDYNRYLLGIEETMNNAFKYEYLLLSLTDDLDTTYVDFMDIIHKNEKGQQKKLILAKNRDFINNFYK